MLRRLTLLIALLLTVFTAAASDWDDADDDNDGFSPAEGDCNDGDPDINPDARETCDDEIDNDCDRLVDFDDPECTVCGGCETTDGISVGAAPLLAIAGLMLLWRCFRYRRP